MLLIALLPALLSAFGIVAYFTNRALVAAESALHTRVANATRQLSGTLPYALVSGDTARLDALLTSELAASRLTYVRVTDAQGRVLAAAGDTLRADLADGHYRRRVEIRLAAVALDDAALYTDGARDRLLGHVEVGVALAQLVAFKRTTLAHAVLLMLAAFGLTAALAGRLSNRLAGQLRDVGEVVGRLARNDLSARTARLPAGEVGALAAGVNTIAEALQAHRSELEQRIGEATADLAARRDMAERAHQAKSRFFAAASHDLRQPLHALSLFVAALRSRNQQIEVETLIENIEAATAAMALLFNSLLDISRLDAGAVEVHPEHFSLKKMLHELEQQFAPLAAEKRLKLRFRPCNMTLYSDPLLIERILVNLISNAIRYTDDGGVLVACRRRGRTMRLCVVDTGRGIAPEQQDNVFHEFVQLHNPARDRSKGLGLGLAIVSRLGRLLGHRIALQSRPGHGSSFSIDVPCGNARLIQAATPPSAPVPIPADALVLLIDDESAILRGMAELFDNWSIDLVTAHSADEAEHWLDGLARVPDVIVSDYRLPGEADGVEVIARLRRKFGRDIPAVVVTGDTAPEALSRIGQAGFPMLHKPLRPAKLRALITHLIQQARAAAVG